MKLKVNFAKERNISLGKEKERYLIKKGYKLISTTLGEVRDEFIFEYKK